MNKWPKSITVDKRIIRTLSSSTYENYPQALKELVVNSYDADATTVNITVEEEKELIVIEDNGWGMNEGDFDFYLRIAGQNREKNDTTPNGRKIVGKFGVGFLSVFPFCKTFQIESKKKGTKKIIKAKIDCSKYFSDEPSSKLIDVGEIPIFGNVLTNENLSSIQYTKISLVGFTKLTEAFFDKKYETKKRNSIQNYHPLDLIKWTFNEYLPLKFKNNENLNILFALNQKRAFNVFLNDEPLFLNPPKGEVLETHKDKYEKIGKIKFRYIISSPNCPIKPSESRLILIRNLNVGVGKRTAYGIGMDSRLYSKLHWIKIDVFVLNGLNDIITVSRDKFNFSQEYDEFVEFFRAKLRFWATVLEQKADIKKLIKEKEDTSKITAITDPEDNIVIKKIAALKKKGISIKDSRKTNNRDLKSVDNTKISSTLNDFLKKKKQLIVGQDVFEVDYGNWDHEKALFPVCKLSENQLKINKSHPLMRNRKFLDVFLKIYVTLCIHYNSNDISKKAYKKILKSLEITFENYNK